MLLYRLAIPKILQLLRLDKLFEEDKPPINSKKKKEYKKLLQLNEELDMYVSLLLSLVCILALLIIPVVVLENPCQIFKEKNMHTIYAVASWLETHLGLIDRLIVVLSVILACAATLMVIDGILTTEISLSPWREQGIYYLPGDLERYPHLLAQRQYYN